jgi:plastocyanin
LITHDLQNWDLWYSTTGSTGPWTTIVMNLPAGDGQVGSIHTYDWTVPNVVDDTVWVRVRMDNSARDYYDVSNAPFSIVESPPIKEVIVGPSGVPAFVPQLMEIEPGDMVRWTWDSTGHNVVSGPPNAPDGAFDSGAPAPAGTVFEVLFDQDFLDANPRPGGIYNYFCAPHADSGMVGTLDVALFCPADFDGDEEVGPFDLALLLGSWGPCPGCPADLDGDEEVGPFDLALLLGSWGPCE